MTIIIKNLKKSLEEETKQLKSEDCTKCCRPLCVCVSVSVHQRETRVDPTGFWNSDGPD